MIHILLIDNYDSFTYNLVQLLRESNTRSKISIVQNTIRTDELPPDIDKVLVSPGPGLPYESGRLMELLAHYIGNTAILGICLGHQAIAKHFNASLKAAETPFHGFAGRVCLHETDDYLFQDIPDGFVCGRYHSWLIDPDSLSDELEVLAGDDQGQIMAIRHKEFDIRGLQFHPESFITQEGHKLIENWLGHHS